MRLAPNLLGGHVGGGAGDLTGPEPLQVLADGQAEIGDVRLTLSVDQDVRGFQVAVDQSGPVGVMRRLGDVDHQPRDPRGENRAARNTSDRFRPSTYSKTTKGSPPSP